MHDADYITSLGTLVLDHRLRRILDHLLEGQTEVYVREGIAFEPRWTSTFLLLEREGPLGVTQIAKRLRYTHPGIIKFVSGMKEAGLVEELDDPGDERRRLIQLTPRARRLAPRLHRIWDALGDAQADLFGQSGCAPLKLLARLDAALERQTLADRVADHLKKEYSR